MYAFASRSLPHIGDMQYKKCIITWTSLSNITNIAVMIDESLLYASGFLCDCVYLIIQIVWYLLIVFLCIYQTETP